MRRTAGKLIALLLTSATVGLAAGIWVNVPYVRQPRYGCGAACVAMLLEYWAQQDSAFRLDHNVPSVRAIQRRLYSKRLHGIVAADMIRYLRQTGLRVFAFKGDWNLLYENLSKGRPLIVCLKVGRISSTRHYVVVVGADASRGLVYLNDPARGKLVLVRRAVFEKSWSAQRKWTLLAVPRTTQ